MQWEKYNHAIDLTIDLFFCNTEIDIYTLFHVKTRPRATFQSCGGVKTTIALKCRQKYKKRFNFIFPFMFCGFAISSITYAALVAKGCEILFHFGQAKLTRKGLNPGPHCLNHKYKYNSTNTIQSQLRGYCQNRSLANPERGSKKL